MLLHSPCHCAAECFLPPAFEAREVQPFQLALTVQRCLSLGPVTGTYCPSTALLSFCKFSHAGASGTAGSSRFCQYSFLIFSNIALLPQLSPRLRSAQQETKNEELALPLNGFLPETISTEHSLVAMRIRALFIPLHT